MAGVWKSMICWINVTVFSVGKLISQHLKNSLTNIRLYTAKFSHPVSPYPALCSAGGPGRSTTISNSLGSRIDRLKSHNPHRCPEFAAQGIYNTLFFAAGLRHACLPIVGASSLIKYIVSFRLFFDEIDKVLAQHYGFTEEELDFIINYDIKYRMGLGRASGTEEDEEE